MNKKIYALIMVIISIFNIIGGAFGIKAKGESTINIESKSAILMEATTGQIIYDTNSDEKVKPASITKIMTLILIFEALDKGEIELDEMVSTSKEAAAMGGSNVYLEEGETLSVDDMIKCIAISSANDASYAMGERIGGTIENFVDMMNNKAKELGMNNTHFVNCHGLDEEEHYSTAKDVAIMSRELITKHPKISEYSTTWMDTIIHKTKRGEKEFGLSNTNKLVRTYDGITGLKTGSTSGAGYCLSATAKRGDISLIAVVMNSKDHKTRFSDCKTLLDYGFSNCTAYISDVSDKYYEVKIDKGKTDRIYGNTREEFSKIFVGTDNSDKVRYEVKLLENIEAPIERNDVIGEIVFYENDEELGSLPIHSTREVKKAKYVDCIKKVASMFF